MKYLLDLDIPRTPQDRQNLEIIHQLMQINEKLELFLPKKEEQIVEQQIEEKPKPKTRKR